MKLYIEEMLANFLASNSFTGGVFNVWVGPTSISSKLASSKSTVPTSFEIIRADLAATSSDCNNHALQGPDHREYVAV